MNIGYARVSTGELTLDLQNDALTAAGCESMHTDIISSPNESRSSLDGAITSIKEG